jgi:hypothetical protein
LVVVQLVHIVIGILLASIIQAQYLVVLSRPIFGCIMHFYRSFVLILGIVLDIVMVWLDYRIKFAIIIETFPIL